MSRPGCPGSWPWRLVWLVAAATTTGMAAGQESDDAAERARIAAERRAVQVRFDSQRAACSGRFVVTDCLDAARAERRQALDQLQRQQAVLDEARRRERAARRQQAIETGAVSADARDAQPLLPPRVAASAATPAPRRASAAAPANPAASAAAQAQRRRVIYEQRQAAAREHQRAVEERNARQDALQKPAAALPLPAPASAASR